MGMRTSIIAISVIAVAIGLSACGNDDDRPASPASSSSAPTTAVAAPTPEQLTKLLDILVDPNQPASEKAKRVTNGENKIGKIEEFSKKLGGYKVGFNPTKISAQGVTATSEVLVASAMAPNAPAPVPMSFDFSGDWKLAEASMCAIFAFAQVKC